MGQNVPYIYEDYVSVEDTAEAIYKLYSMGPIEREKLGKKQEIMFRKSSRCKRPLIYGMSRCTTWFDFGNQTRGWYLAMKSRSFR